MTFSYVEYSYDVIQDDKNHYIATLQADDSIKWESENLSEIHIKAARIITQYIKFKKHLHKDPMLGIIHTDNLWDR